VHGDRVLEPEDPVGLEGTGDPYRRRQPPETVALDEDLDGLAERVADGADRGEGRLELGRADRPSPQRSGRTARSRGPSHPRPVASEAHGIVDPGLEIVEGAQGRSPGLGQPTTGAVS
jgi:hypothetical protein